MIRDHQKRKLLVDLEKSGNVYLACVKNNIARATYYRWIENDKAFRKLAEKAVRIGRENNCDVAEHSLMINVKDKKMDAIKYVLSHNSPHYKSKRTSKVVLEHRSIKEKIAPAVTLEDVIDKIRGNAQTAFEKRKQRAAEQGLPLKPDGYEIMPWELKEYSEYIREWRKHHGLDSNVPEALPSPPHESGSGSDSSLSE